MSDRSREFEKISDRRSVLQIALEIHKVNTGGSEFHPETYANDRVVIEQALRNWKPTAVKEWRAFDDLVKELLNVILHEKSVVKRQ